MFRSSGKAVFQVQVPADAILAPASRSCPAASVEPIVSRRAAARCSTADAQLAHRDRPAEASTLNATPKENGERRQHATQRIPLGADSRARPREGYPRGERPAVDGPAVSGKAVDDGAVAAGPDDTHAATPGLPAGDPDTEHLATPTGSDVTPSGPAPSSSDGEAVTDRMALPAAHHAPRSWPVLLPAVPGSPGAGTGSTGTGSTGTST